MYPASSNSSTLNGESQHDRGVLELAPWRTERDTEPAPCPLPQYLRINHRLLPRPFYFFLPTCLSLYLSHVVLLFVSLYAFSAPSLLLARYTSPIPSRSLFINLFLLRPLPYVYSSLRRNCSPSISNAEEEVPGEFLTASSREGL